MQSDILVVAFSYLYEEIKKFQFQSLERKATNDTYASDINALSLQNANPNEKGY